jgi:hypothetical protein
MIRKHNYSIGLGCVDHFLYDASLHCSGYQSCGSLKVPDFGETTIYRPYYLMTKLRLNRFLKTDT